MNIEKLKAQVIHSEGIRTTAYKDTLNNWTIGVGHLIKIPDEEYLLAKELTDLEVDQIFTTDLNQAIDDARKFIDVDILSEEAFFVVVDMAFNLGLPKLMRFQNFQQALKKELGMSFISMISMEVTMNITDVLLTGGAILTWWVVPIMLFVGFITPWPYNYWRLKKYNIACH